MSRDASITLPFADREYTFRLRWGEWIRLQETLDAGPFVIANRLLSGQWRVQDVSQVILWGLVGGGLEEGKARSLVKAYVEDRPPMDTVMLAAAIAGAGCKGAPDGEAPGEAGAAPETETA